MCRLADEKSEKVLNGEEQGGDAAAETQNSEGNADECDPLGPNCYYDKSKSFFDNISCDDTRYESTQVHAGPHGPGKEVLICVFCPQKGKREVRSLRFPPVSLPEVM